MPDGAQIAAAAASCTIAAEGPVLVFGGCYSNREATEALLATAERLGVPPARMICTGDVVAYGAGPQATLDLVRGAGIATVMGNCEESLASEAADCGCGFAPGSACARLSDAWFTYAARHVDEAARRWMAALPRRIDLLLGGRRIAIVHGAPSRINRFIFRSFDQSEFAAELTIAGTDGVIGGHCGLPFTRRIGRRLWHNAGAIGLPANDGTPRGWFSLLTPRGGGVEVRHVPLSYDHRAAARAMRAAGLPVSYAEALESGVWPSFDVLPGEEQAATGQAITESAVLWDAEIPAAAELPGSRPFVDRLRTVRGEPHATVPLSGLETLWFNTGTLCNIACVGCYIESTPRNDRLQYLSRASFDRFLDEAEGLHPELREIGFTGGEPFMNPAVPGMIEAALARGYRVLVLTNAMRPMQRHKRTLARLHAAYGARFALRVSLDHPTRQGHERIRGRGTFEPALAGLLWLSQSGFSPAVAARIAPGTEEADLRAQFVQLFGSRSITVDAVDPASLVFFPELNGDPGVPEISETCWQALRGRGRSVMCSSSRMIVHRTGEAEPSVVACTLQPYEPRFDFGHRLADACGPVALNHPHCARFCVFGAASCSARTQAPTS